MDKQAYLQEIYSTAFVNELEKVGFIMPAIKNLGSSFATLGRGMVKHVPGLFDKATRGRAMQGLGMVARSSKPAMYTLGGAGAIAGGSALLGRRKPTVNVNNYNG